jgi:hypothetical protein
MRTYGVIADVFHLNRYSADEMQETGILHMAIEFEPTAANAVDFLDASQAKLSCRPELKPASGQVSPKSFAVRS